MSLVDAVLGVWLGAWSVLLLLAVANSAVELRRIRILLRGAVGGTSGGRCSLNRDRAAEGKGARVMGRPPGPA